MDNYYVEFTGDLKDNQFLQRRFFKQYNKWCDVINGHISELNESFDKNWDGEPITNYVENEEYQNWMLSNYRRILKESKLDKDMYMQYEIGEELDLIGIGRLGHIKGKRLGFVIKRG